MPISVFFLWFIGLVTVVPVAVSWGLPILIIGYIWWLWRRVRWWWWAGSVVWLGWQLSVLLVLPLGFGWRWFLTVWATLHWWQWLAQGLILLGGLSWQWWRRQRHVAVRQQR